MVIINLFIAEPVVWTWRADALANILDVQHVGKVLTLGHNREMWPEQIYSLFRLQNIIIQAAM